MSVNCIKKIMALTPMFELATAKNDSHDKPSVLPLDLTDNTEILSLTFVL